MSSPRLSRLALSLLTAAAALVAVPTTPASAEASAEARPVASTVRIAAGDSDGDGIDDATDGCPTVAGATATGCPSATRRARLRYLADKNLLQARVSSPVTACSARARVKLWRVTRRGDVRLQEENTSFSGKRRFRVPRGAVYYVTVSTSYSSGVAECAQAVSRSVTVPGRP